MAKNNPLGKKKGVITPNLNYLDMFMHSDIGIIQEEEKSNTKSDVVEDLKQNEKLRRFVRSNKDGSRAHKPRHISSPPKRRDDNVNVPKEEKESERRDPSEKSWSRTQYLKVSLTPERHLHGDESH